MFADWPYQWYGWAGWGCAESRCPTFEEMVDENWHPCDLPFLVEYLQNSPVARITPQDSDLCHNCRKIIPNRGVIYWDNVWLWSADLIHHVQEHSVRLPDRMVEYIREKRYEPPLREECDFDRSYEVQQNLSEMLFGE